MFPSLAISPWRCFYFIFAKFESIIHKNGQKAWGSSASSDNFSAHPLLSRDEHVTNDSAERDGSSWRMCTLICFLRSSFLDKFFVNHLDLSRLNEGCASAIPIPNNARKESKHDGIFCALFQSSRRFILERRKSITKADLGDGKTRENKA